VKRDLGLEMRIFREIGNRYDERISGWFMDDGCCWYPAEQRPTVEDREF
jgi:hypothetical protein